MLKKTAQEVEQTAAAKATASAALAAAPGNLVNHPGGMASPMPSPRVQQPASSPFPGASPCLRLAETLGPSYVPS